MTLEAALNGISTDVQTDLQNLPIDRVSDTHKLLGLLMSHWDWCNKSANNHFSAASSHVSNRVLTIEM